MSKGRRPKPPVALPPGASFRQLPDGSIEYSMETDHGSVAYRLRREDVRRELLNMIVYYRARLEEGVSIKEESASEGVRHFTIKAEESFAKSSERLSEYALYMFERDLSAFLKDMTSQYADEVFYRVLRLLFEAGAYERNASEIEMLEGTIARSMVKALKLRLGAPTRGGKRRQLWTAERDEAFYALYETCYKEVQRAKEIYRRNKGFNWKQMVKADNPLLPDAIVDKLPLKGSSGPGDLAREYAAILFDVKNKSTLTKVITRAKRARAAKVARKKRITVKG